MNVWNTELSRKMSSNEYIPFNERITSDRSKIHSFCECLQHCTALHCLLCANRGCSLVEQRV